MSRFKILRRLIGVVAALALTFGIFAVSAGPAEAATKTVWDKVATCESGGRWKINTGNGYYGGLQFSARTWSGHGGKKYGKTANKATKAEQIAIARRVLATQGPGAWGGCARKAGLTKKNGKASKSATPSTNPGVKKIPKKKAQAKKPDTAVPVGSVVHNTYKVKPGDTVRKIAKRLHIAGGWEALWKLNRTTMKNPNSIYVGQVLKIS